LFWRDNLKVPSVRTGRCRVCGEERQLTYEHVPPRAAYNSEPSKRYKLAERWAIEAGKPARYESQQRGAGDYALCELCNNNTGIWYVPELTRLVEAGATVVRKLSAELARVVSDPTDVVTIRMKIVRSYPARFTKEMISMLLAINDPTFGDAYPELREFVLDRAAPLPPQYRLYLSLFDRDVAREAGRYTAMRGIGTPSTHAFEATELSYPPYTYVLTIDERPDEERPGDITQLTRYSYGERVPEIELSVPLNWTLLPHPL
jgi:hypothetical protein